MKHVVNLSGGVTSWAAARLVKDRIMGAGDDLVLLFADTLQEDDDVYRFLHDGARDIGVPVTRVCYGMTPWQVFWKRKMLGDNRSAVCSVMLKRKQLDRWRRENCDPSGSLHHVGLDAMEVNRFETHARILREKGWNARAPLIEYRLSKPQCIKMAEDAGLVLPAAYSEGFGHANCRGQCVRAGIGHWTKLYEVHPDRFLDAERREQEFREHFGRDVSILKKRGARGTSRKTLTLRMLRERIEEGERASLPFDEHGGCGCALEEADDSNVHEAEQG